MIVLKNKYSIFSKNNNEKLYTHKYKHFIRDCFNLKRYHRKTIKIESLYVSICIPAYNMKDYIEKAIISILNQSFQNYEIIVVNDYSKDETLKVIKKLQLKDKRIKLINHSKNSGVYSSRVDSILVSKGKYLMLMDSDDMLINPNILEYLFNYNLKYNLDLIEFTVISFLEKTNSLIYIEKYHHFHYFSKTIISKPQLDDIQFNPNTVNKAFNVECRIIWNKIIKKSILIKSIQYIGKEYYKKFFITAEDTILNLISFHFAKNFSNIKIPGYMYNIREISMTHGKKGIRKKIIFCYNHLLYLTKLYDFVQNFNKSRRILYNELLDLNKRLIQLNKLTKNNSEILLFYNKILNDKYVFKNFRDETNKTFASIIKNYNNYSL
jgi:glycosyltransferase involved in cell wall biosynthesis